MQAVQAAGELAWRLGQLTGSDGAVEPVIGDGARPVAEALPFAAEADAMPVESNSEWQLAHAQKMQAEAEASFASRAFYPDIAGFAVYNYRSSGREWDPAGEWAAGVRLSLPLLDGGRSIAALSTTRASLQAAEENLQAVAQRARAEREVAIAARAAALSRLRSIEEAARRKETFVEAQRDLYASGRLSLSKLETQETELLQLALQAKALNYETLRATIQVSRAAGTLDKEMLLMITGEETR
jgi:outer membrane protein TolC